MQFLKATLEGTGASLPAVVPVAAANPWDCVCEEEVPASSVSLAGPRD